MMIMFTTIGAKDVVLLSTPCTKLLGGGSWGHKSRKQKGGEGCKVCSTFATVSWSGAGRIVAFQRRSGKARKRW